MAESHVVSALANKRAEIAGMIARAQQQIGQFRADPGSCGRHDPSVCFRNGARDDLGKEGPPI